MIRPDWTMIRRPGSPILFFICMLTVLAIGWRADHVSCVRTDVLRSSLAVNYRGAIVRATERATVDRGLARYLDEQQVASLTQALERVHQLDCSQPFPPTS